MLRSTTCALGWLGLALAVPSLVGDAHAAPTTPPPPSAAPKATPPPPSSAPASPFLPTTPTPSAGPSTTPPPPSAPPPPDPSFSPTEPEPPPQDLSNTWGFSRTQPLVPRYVQTDSPSYAAPNPVGFYSGVSVQGNHVPPFPAPPTAAPPAVITWVGFERAPEGSRVFFQLSAEAAHELTTDGLTLRIRMRNTKVNVRNNLRYLDLRYFKTPVRTVKVTRRGKDTVATVVLQREAIPRVEIIDGKAGYKLLIVQFADALEAAPSAAP